MIAKTQYKSDDSHNPAGIEFFDMSSGKIMRLVIEGTYKGWIVYRHPDGQWVTLRKATEQDRKQLATALLVIDVLSALT